MNNDTVALISWLVTVVGVIVVFARLRRRKSSIGPGAGGSIYDMLSEDKRNAIEIIAEARAEARNPETRDGNLPISSSPDVH